MKPVMLKVPDRTAALMRRRANMPAVQHRAGADALEISPDGLIGADVVTARRALARLERGAPYRGQSIERRALEHYPVESLAVGEDAAPAPSRDLRVRFYRDAPGKFRGLAYVPLTLRDRATGAPRRVMLAVQLTATIEDEGAVVGADGSVTQTLLAPLLDKVTAVVTHPLAALAAAATVLIPGIGPAYLVGYTIGQSLVGYANRKVQA